MQWNAQFLQYDPDTVMHPLYYLRPVNPADAWLSVTDHRTPVDIFTH